MSDDYGRRKWQVVGDIPKKKTQEKPEEELETLVLPNERTEFLKARQHNLKLEAKVGKTLTIAKDASGSGSLKGRSPFFCAVCDVDFNDSHSYVDHLNGRRHNRILGMNMKVEAATADKVRDKLEMLAKRAPVKIDMKSLLETDQPDELGIKTTQSKDHKEEDIEGEEEEEDEIDKAMAALGLPTKLK